MGAGCLLSLATFLVLGLGFVAEPHLFEHHPALISLWWASAIATLALGVASCRVDEDPGEKPEYLGSLVRGLLDEWRRPGRIR